MIGPSAQTFAALRWALSSMLASLRARKAGVRLGHKVKFLGLPIITLAPGSTIEIGAKSVLVSSSAGTALGVRGPAVLRTLRPGATLRIGSDVGLSGGAICAAVSVSIGDRCLIGADCTIFDTDFHNHPVGGDAQPRRRYAPPEWDAISAPVTIGDDVFLGTRVTVCKGVTIGDGTIVGAGSVVTSDLPPLCIAAGVPARVIKALPPSATS